MNNEKQPEKPVLPSLPIPKGGPILDLDYDAFADSGSLKRLLKDLALAVLSGKISTRQAGSVRSLVSAWIRLDEHGRIERLEKKIKTLEEKKR